MKLTEAKKTVLNGGLDEVFARLYGDVAQARRRYADALDAFAERYGAERDIRLFSAPGRTEVGGNHTDHQHGCVLAAAINLDVIAVVSENTDRTVRVKSKGYEEDCIPLEDLTVHPEEYGKARALIRGMAASFVKKGYPVGGFDAYTTSDVLKGSGMSSSAAFEVLIGTVLNGLFADDAETAVSVAQMAQYAENIYFGKPCGLMDQTASAVGGFIAIDFADPSAPIVEKVNLDLAKQGYCLCITDAGGNHADLTDDYASITVEMRKVAKAFGKEVLREVDPAAFYGDLASARAAAGDRGVLRAMHFFADNDRVSAEKEALNRGDLEAFFACVNQSGDSSWMLLQNLYSVSAPTEQPLALALCLAKKALRGKGACRVHGGGFAGTIQAFVPLDQADAFRKELSAVFGESACHFLFVRPDGGMELPLA